MIMEEQKRRFSEAGVNRRPSAAHILTEVSIYVRMKFDNEEELLFLRESWTMIALVIFVIICWNGELPIEEVKAIEMMWTG